MKSLEECIKEMQRVHYRFNCEGCFYCPFQIECHHGDCYVEDIHQYLKEYQNFALSLRNRQKLEGYETA